MSFDCVDEPDATWRSVVANLVSERRRHERTRGWLSLSLALNLIFLLCGFVYWTSER